MSERRSFTRVESAEDEFSPFEKGKILDLLCDEKGEKANAELGMTACRLLDSQILLCGCPEPSV